MQKWITSRFETSAPPGSDLVSVLKSRFDSHEVFLTGRGASAIYAAIKGIDNPGTHVAIPSNVCASIPLAIIQAGYKPFFLDISLSDFNIDISDLPYVPSDTSALVAPHMFGHPLKILEIMDFCSQNNILLIEDIAQAFGTSINGRMCGTFGDLAVISFHPSKILPGAGGGALLVNNKSLEILPGIISQIQKLPDRDQSMDSTTQPIVSKINELLNGNRGGSGSEDELLNLYNQLGNFIPSRFDPSTELINISAIYGLDNILASRKARSEKYRELIDHPLVDHPSLGEGHPLFRHSVIITGENSERLRRKITDRLRHEGIHASNLYYPLHLVFDDSSSRSLKNSEYVGSRIINLWLDNQATDEYILATARVFNEVLFSC
jgi:dTDP-4-amino-4,6-dideoxygalactose transaminase